ncbi:hypothetical protein ABF176_002548 [Flavobacterium psychrophilum]
MKLIPMTDFVLKKYSEWVFDDNIDLNSSARYISSTQNYANFLKQPLTLGMFIPCDDDGNVLEEPSHYELYVLGIAPNEIQVDVCGKYEIAQSKVIFKDFYFKDSVSIPTVRNILQDVIIDVEFNNTIPDMTIEDLVHDNLDLAVSF